MAGQPGHDVVVLPRGVPHSSVDIPTVRGIRENEARLEAMRTIAVLGGTEHHHGPVRTLKPWSSRFFEASRISLEYCLWAVVLTAGAGVALFVGIALTPEGVGLACETAEARQVPSAYIVSSGVPQPPPPQIWPLSYGWLTGLAGALPTAVAMFLPCWLATRVARPLQRFFLATGDFARATFAGASVESSGISPPCMSSAIRCSVVCVLSLLAVVALAGSLTANIMLLGVPRVEMVLDNNQLSDAGKFMNLTRGRTLLQGGAHSDPGCSGLPWIFQGAARGGLFAGEAFRNEVRRLSLSTVSISVTPMLARLRRQQLDETSQDPSVVLAVVGWFVSTSDRFPYPNLGPLGCEKGPRTETTDLCVQGDPPCNWTIVGTAAPVCGPLYRASLGQSGSNPSEWPEGVGQSTVASLVAQAAASMEQQGVVVVPGAGVVEGDAPNYGASMATLLGVLRTIRFVVAIVLVSTVVLASSLRAWWVCIMTSRYHSHQQIESVVAKMPSVQRCCCGVRS
jgi:hypothetical protein